MKKFLMMLAVVMGAYSLSSCVSKKQFTNLENDYKQLKTKSMEMAKSYQDTKVQLAESKANTKSLEDRLAEARKANDELRSAYAALQSSLDKSIQQNTQGSVNISKLVDEINASNKFIKQLVEAKDKSDSLNMVLTNNLTR